MKPHKDLSIKDILHVFQSGEHELPEKIGEPTSYAERMEANDRISKIAQDINNIRTLCVGCGDDVPVVKAAMCECGGFVCEACREMEDEGVCNHEPHVF